MNQRGDTIVEVLVSIAIVGVALAGGYALSSHSLRTGIDASRRSAALMVAQGQVEFLKNSVINNSTGQYTVNSPQPFCIDDSNGQRLNNVTADCTTIADTPYDIEITYSGDPNRIFTIIPSWESLGSNVRGKTTLYYKLPDNF